MSSKNIVLSASWDFEIEVEENVQVAKPFNINDEDDDDFASRRNRGNCRNNNARLLTDGSANGPVAARALFKVERAVLMKIPADDMRHKTFFQGMFKSGYVETQTKKLTLRDTSINAIEIILRRFHDCMTDEMYRVPIEDVYNVEAACHEHNIEGAELTDWFETWYSMKTQPEEISYYDWMRQLVYPCYIFDYAKGFAVVTKYLVYNTVHHIIEQNPTVHRHLHLPRRVTQQLNAARGRLKTLLHRGLEDPVDKLLELECTCCEATLFHYQKALKALKAWPLEKVFSSQSAADILARLRPFDWEPKSDACLDCRGKSYKSIVLGAVKNIAASFDGMCLDCMDISIALNDDTDYWTHDQIKKWDSGCRINHGQATWYYSFLGRNENMKRHNEAKYARNAAARANRG